MLSAACCNAFEGALERGKSLPPKDAYDECVSACKKHNVGYDFRGTCDNFLVHEGNRSKLMLSAGQAHKNGEKIHYAGADLDELKAAYAFELSKDPERRAIQHNKNKISSKELKGFWPMQMERNGL